MREENTKLNYLLWFGFPRYVADMAAESVERLPREIDSQSTQTNDVKMYTCCFIARRSGLLG